MKHKTILDKMTLEDKVALCSGADNWHTRIMEQYGIPAIRMSDGPHGLRKQDAGDDQLAINNSVPATCFPTASLTACSWDRDLLREMGAAIGEEALQEGVSIVLGPGLNIKRNPLCGRNFEYFSEDPYLAGELGASWIDGVQAQGVGTSVKHFAANSQENERMSSDSILDERTLREIYLPAFEKAVKSARPATVMCAYNQLNGTYCSDNRNLLRNILRDEWGFEGVIVTDWGAMNDRVKAFEAGLDLEMPGSQQGYFDAMVVAAVHSGELSEERINESVDRLLDLILASAARIKSDYRYSIEDHHLLAKKIAAHSAVLLQNEGNILPIPKGKKIALIGALAKESRYQGAGSSHINPTKLSSVIDGFNAVGLEYTYFEGYPFKGPPNPALIAEAAAGAAQSDLAVIVAGLPEEYESEGFDRETLSMPAAYNELIITIAAANPNVVVLLVGGAPVEMPWLSKVKAVLNLYLAGQAGGLAAAELLVGMTNPSGKLAESYPQHYADVPSSGIYAAGGKQAQYREGIYVGYRYYDTAHKNVLFPFGHGMSYTTFEYSELEISAVELAAPHELNVSFSVRNTGRMDGAEVAQVYIAALDCPVFRPEKELKQFTKIDLKAGEAAPVKLTLDARAFAVYDPEEGKWIVPGGVYKVLVGASSRDIRLSAELKVVGPVVKTNQQPEWYRNPAGQITQNAFEMLLGRKIEPLEPVRQGEYTLACSLNDMRDSFFIRLFTKVIESAIAKSFGGADYSIPP